MKTLEEISNIIKNIPYKENVEWPIIEKDESEPLFKNLIKARMEHCLSELEKWKDNPKTYTSCSGQIVYFPNGKHFSFPVYEQLQDALKLNMAYWSRLVWQQIVRHMYLSGVKNIELFTYATESLLVIDEVRRTSKSEIAPKLAIDLAEMFNLGYEVEHCIFELGMSPEEALREWDLPTKPLRVLESL